MSDTKAFFNAFSKSFGTIGRLASEKQKHDGDVILFPSTSLGDASHYWGVPLGKITQFHGPEGCGKTMFAMLLVRQAQLQYPGTFAVWIDAESSFSTKWARQLGIDVDRLIIIDSNNAGEIFTALVGRTNDQGKKIDLGIFDHIRAGTLKCNLIVLDSIANLLYPIEENRDLGDHEMAAAARFLLKSMKRVLPELKATNTAFVCINQAREKIGERIPTLTYPGGRAYRHALSLAILFKASGAKDGQVQDANEHKQGHKILATVEKTRGGPNQWKSEFWLDFAKGVVNRGAELAALGDAYKVLERPNNVMWKWGDISIKGKDAFAAHLEANPELMDKMLQQIKAAKEAGLERDASMGVEDDGVVSEAFEDTDPNDIESIAADG